MPFEITPLRGACWLVGLLALGRVGSALYTMDLKTGDIIREPFPLFLLAMEAFPFSLWTMGPFLFFLGNHPFSPPAVQFHLAL